MADIDAIYDLIGQIEVVDGTPYTIVDPVVTPTSTNPVQSKGIYDFVRAQLRNAVDGEARADIADLMIEVNKLDQEIQGKMEFYKIDYANNLLSHDGVVLTYSEIIAKYNDPKYFIYVEGDGYTYIPTLPPLEGDEIIEFSSTYLYGGHAYTSRVIINSLNQIKHEEIQLLRADEAPAGGVTKEYVDQKDAALKTQIDDELAEIRELSGKIELPLEVGKTVISGGVRVYEDSNYNLRIPQGSNIKVKKGDTLVVTIPSGYIMTTPSLWNGITFLGNIPNNGYEFTNDYDDIIVNIGFSNNVSAINKKDILVNYTNAFIYSYEKRFDSMDNTVSSLRNFVNDTIDGSPEIHSEDFTFTVGKFFNINSHSIMSASGYAVCEINISSEYDAIYVKSNNMTGTAIRPIVFYDGTNYTTWGEYNTAVDTVVDIPSGTIKAYITVNSNSDYKSYFVKKGVEGVNDKINYLNDTVNPLKGKKIAFFGDSIVGTNYTTPTWWQYIEQLTGCIPTNYGVSGTSIAYHSDRETTFGKCFANRYSEMANDFDAVVVMGGTNDIDNVTGTPIGNWNDTTNTTLFGALNILIKGLFNKFNGKPIIFCTPISRNYANNSSDVNVLDPLTVLSSKSPTDTLTGQLVAEAIKAKCRQYGMRYIDMQACGITGSDEAHEYFRPSDSYHPSELGQKVIANTVLPYLENCFRI